MPSINDKPEVPGSHWCRQCIQEQRDWFRSRVIPPAELEAYCKGFEDGFKKALALLQLHGAIKGWH